MSTENGKEMAVLRMQCCSLRSEDRVQKNGGLCCYTLILVHQKEGFGGVNVFSLLVTLILC